MVMGGQMPDAQHPAGYLLPALDGQSDMLGSPIKEKIQESAGKHNAHAHRVLCVGRCL